MFECCYGPRDKTNPGHWDCKMRGGPRAEWWACIMEGARRVLDVGCGFGFPGFYLAACGHEVVGIDPSPSQIAQAETYRRQEGPTLNLTYMVNDQTTLPFEDDSFDGATFSNSLECVGDPEALVREVIRVLKPGAPVAIHEEDRLCEPRTHPVWEKTRLCVIDGAAYLHVETRVCEPYLDRRYMIRLADDGPVSRKLRGLADQDRLDWRNWSTSLDDFGLSLDGVLAEGVSAEYGEAPGYDPYTLRDFVERMGLVDVAFWVHNVGRRFAEELEAAGVLKDMPDDIRAVSRALVKSLGPISTPTAAISCRTPSCRAESGAENQP
jgi:SAM-dependent methyltransferase